MTERPWLAEQEVSTQLARNLIEHQFPELSPVYIQPLGMGWDNTVFQVNQSWVFRFPRREMALALMDTEWKCLPQLAQVLSLDIPRPHFHGQPSSEFGWPFTGYTWVPGQTACRANLSPKQRRELVGPLAHFLKALHHRKWDDFLNLPQDPMQKVNISLRAPQIRERLKHADNLGLLPQTDPYFAFLKALPLTTPSPRQQNLVHGDLYIRHLLVNATGQLTGVIDWGDTHWGDPACDLSVVYSVLPPDCHAEFWQKYGPVSPETQTLARMRALFHNLALLLYSTDIGDADLKRESLLALDWFVQV